jgi:hypothetical protein
VLAAAAALSVATAAAFMREKPPEAHTGGFGEPTCQECHTGEPLNQAPGAIRIAGLPQSYEPGRAYPLTVFVTAPELKVGGFELAARFADGKQAGRFEATTPGATVTKSQAGIEYISHTLEGIAATRDTVRWAILWRAPSEARQPVTFHLAGNAANDDASPLGDHIHTATTTVSGGTRTPPLR